MTYLFKLARRTAHQRALPLILSAAALAGCNSDALTNSDEEPAGTSTPTAAPTPQFATSFRGGIPFGTWALPTELFGPVYNGAMRNISPNQLLEELAAIKARGGRVVLAFAGPEWFFQDSDGHFSLSMWKSRVDRFKGINFTSYLDDGTIIGHYMIDEPNDPVNWNGEPVEGPMLEQMAAYSKQLWPKLATVVRAKPTYMGKWGTIYRDLDVAWAQWWTTQGDPTDYIRREVAEAQRLGLSLITGLNIRKGGPNQTYLDPSIAQSAGSALLANDYPCAFISWEYDETYLARADVKAAMSNLSQKAAAHSPRICSGGPVSLPSIQGIALTGARVVVDGSQIVYLDWKGAAGTQVDLYRNGEYRRTTANDGHAQHHPMHSGVFTYKICEAGTTKCSNSVSVTIN